MRLTLRTLLAYRDGVLSSADSAELHERIHQSEDASNLLQRVNRVVQNVERKSATLVGKGMGADPNSVSEYLDDALPSERVPELERICLEDDEYLGELAGCHNLLSSAMHTRVRIPEDLKELACRIGDPAEAEEIKQGLADRRRPGHAVIAKPITRADQPVVGLKGPNFSVAKQTDSADPQATPAAGLAQESNLVSGLEERDAVGDKAANDGTEAVLADTPMLRSGGDSIRPSGFNLEGGALAREVPEYLIGKRRGQWMIPIAIVGLTLLLGVVLWQALGPWDRLQTLLTVGTPEAASEDRDAAGDTRVDEGGLLAVNETDSTAEGDQEVAVDGVAEVLPSDTSPESSVGKSEVVPAEALASEADEDRVGSMDSGAGDAEAISSETKSPSGEIPADSAPDLNGLDTDSGALGGEPPTPRVPTAAWTPGVRDGASVGILQAANGDLRTLQSGVAIPVGNALLVPSHNVLTLTTSDEAKVQAVGPTRLTNFTDSEKEFEFDLGRLLVTAGPQLSVAFGSGFGDLRLEFDNEQSTAALECGWRFASYGSILDSGAYMPVLIVVADGPTRVTLDGTINVALTAGEGVALIGDEKPKTFKLQTIPEWYGLPEGRPIDQEAVVELAEDLARDGGAEINDTLKRLATHWRAEEAALAVSACLLSNEWDVLFESGFLDNPNAAIHVESVLSLARDVLASDPQRAERFTKRWSDEWGQQEPNREKTLRFLLGLPESALKKDQHNAQIDILDSEFLADRYIGYFELKRVFGRRFGFKPAEPNRASILSWRREAALGRLEPVALPGVIRERLKP
ncbi:MAG: hypothetical protein AB8B50_11000 [Pirellulaceae bacterium]